MNSHKWLISKNGLTSQVVTLEIFMNNQDIIFDWKASYDGNSGSTALFQQALHTGNGSHKLQCKHIIETGLGG